MPRLNWSQKEYARSLRHDGNPPVKRSYTKLLECELAKLIRRGDVRVEDLDPRLRPYVRDAAGRSAAA